MAKAMIYYEEAKEFNRMEDCAEKVELAISRLENPYNLSDEDWVMYRDYLSKTGPKTVPEFIEKNKINAFPMLVKHRVIRKANINKMVDMAQDMKRMDILSYLLNAGNDFRMHPKTMDIAPKFTPGKTANNREQKLPDKENVKTGDIIWMGKTPMPWLVLDKKDDRLTVISKYAFDCRAYNNTFYKKKWTDSALSKWLNEEFFHQFFSESEKAAVADVYFDSEDVLFTTDSENVTGQKMYLLSIDEANRYFRTPQEKKARVTILGRRRILWQSFGTYAHWWLRNQSFDRRAGQSHVLDNGEISRYGGIVQSNGYDEFYDHFGVRPAMQLIIK